jgi:hypothetical protein
MCDIDHFKLINDRYGYHGSRALYQAKTQGYVFNEE